MGIDIITNIALSNIILYFQGVYVQFIGQALAGLANLFSLFLKSQGNYFEDITIVKTSWTVFRDFANMFFILILVIIAFATIFNNQKYNWKGLIAKFLLAALLINFSLVIGGFIINIASTLNNVMLAQFSDITENLAGGFGLHNLINASQTKVTGNTEIAVASAIISTIGIIIVATITFLSMLAAFVFSIVRVPILWALLIVSPLAWIASILPGTRKMYSDWWKAFLGWTFFMPMYLFTLVMGIAILANRPDLDAAAKMSISQDVLSRTGNLFGFAAQDIFFYILTIIILIGGLGLSLKMSFAGSSGVTKVFGGISKGINGYVKRQAGVTGAQEAFNRVKKEGLPEKWGWAGQLYTGSRGAQKTTANREQWLSKQLGFRPDMKRQKQEVGEIDAEIGRLRDLESAGQLKVDGAFATEAYKKDRNSIRGAAERMLLYEKGMIDGTEFQKDQLGWIEKNPFLAQSSADKAEKGKYKKVPPKDLINMAKAEGAYAGFKTDAATATRKKWYKHIQGDAKALSDSEFNDQALINGIGIFGADTPEGGDFIKDVGKVRPDLVANYNLTLPPTKIGAPVLTKAEHIEKMLKDPEDIAKMPMDVWNNSNFITALASKFAALAATKKGTKAVNDYRTKLENAVINNNFGADRADKLSKIP
ncbi:MAG: hypothetical protein Q7S32_03475 [bacterium]|nr:hypothetical protein [bacterium]